VTENRLVSLEVLCDRNRPASLEVLCDREHTGVIGSVVW